MQLSREDIRKKYLKLVESIGLDKAVTQLHNEIGALEPKIYDGGFKEERLAHVQFLRSLCRDLWDLRIAKRPEPEVGFPGQDAK